MDKVFHKGDLTPISHNKFNEFIKGKGFKGRNNYKLSDLVTGSPVMISYDGTEPMRFNSMSAASTSTGISYVTLLYAKRNSRHQVHSNGKNIQ